MRESAWKNGLRHECRRTDTAACDDEESGHGAALSAFAAVRLAGEGWPAKEIAAITGASVRSVHYGCRAWQRSTQRRRPEKALAEKSHPGRQPGVSALNRERLLAEMAQDPRALGYAAANWTVPLLASHLQRLALPVTARTLRRRLHAAGLGWKRPRYVFAVPEPNVTQKKGPSRAA
jgi:transposase